jgi:hypothetical protein
MFFDGFAGNARKVIHLFDRPAARGGVVFGAFKVMGGAFALRLILAGNADQDANVLRCTVVFHKKTSHQKNTPARREKSVCNSHKLFYTHWLTEKQFLSETALAKLAEQFRQKAKKSRAQAARELRVSQTTIFNT